MKIGIISDIHANLPGLNAVTQALDAEGVEDVLVAGDFMGYYLDINEVIDHVRSRGWTAIRGNHDEYLLGLVDQDPERESLYRTRYSSSVIRDENRQWLATLPAVRHLDLAGRQVILSHGSPWHVDEYVYPTRADWSAFDELESDVVVMGHTHHPLVRQARRAMLINPGSCGQPRDHDARAAFAVLDLTTMNPVFRRAVYDVSALQERLRRHGIDEKAVSILSRTRETA